MSDRQDENLTEEPLPAIPARMINQYVFCPRYFYLAWVDQHRVHNDNTLVGVAMHRVVDQPKGDVADSRRGRATSIDAASAALGVVAKIDVVEDDPETGGVIVVDIKTGEPMSDGEAWPGDAAQALAGAIALRDSGYNCRRAAVWYARPRQRVTLDVSADRERWLADLVAEMRTVAASASAPPPLLASPRCPTCSLVGVCLPDEENVLTARSDAVPRRLVPRDRDDKPLYVTEQGAVIGVRGERLSVSKDGQEVANVRLIDVSGVCIYGNVQLTSYAMREFFSREIPVSWFSYGGWFQGLAVGLPAKNVRLRVAQAQADESLRLHAASRIVAGKVRNSRTLLRRNARRDVAAILASLKRLESAALSAGAAVELLGIEGAAARLYFSQFAVMLRQGDEAIGGFDFAGRNRRPATDPVNALLSFTYGLLVRDLTVICHQIGLDPYQGVYHRPRFGRPAMALDLAEEFRPIVADSVVIGAINNGEITLEHVEHRAGAVQLARDGRRNLIRAYERRLDTQIEHPVFGYKISYRRILDVQTRLMAAFLVGEFDEYRAFVTR